MNPHPSPLNPQPAEASPRPWSLEFDAAGEDFYIRDAAGDVVGDIDEPGEARDLANAELIVAAVNAAHAAEAEDRWSVRDPEAEVHYPPHVVEDADERGSA